MKTALFNSLFLVLLFLGCENKHKSDIQKCVIPKIEMQKSELEKFTEIILSHNPVLEKITVVDALEIDTVFKKELDIFFSDFCQKVLETKAFEKFAFVYWYNVKYHQYLCCVPAESQIISPSFFDKNSIDRKDYSDITLYFLLQKHNVNKNAVANNGFTQSSLYFTQSRELFKDDSTLNSFIIKVDSIQKWAYENALSEG